MSTKIGTVIGIATCLTLGATLAFANPQLEDQNKSGYPMPGTSATDEYGKKAEQAATTEVNREYIGDCAKVSNARQGGSNKEGYPYPGTSAMDEYGKKAEQQAATEVNKEYAGGSGQGSRGVPCSK